MNYIIRYSNNPDLNPEHSNSFDLGLSGSVELSGLHEFQLNYFYVDAKNKIVYQSLYPYLPYNIAKATHQGIDARYDYHSIDNIVDIILEEHILKRWINLLRQIPRMESS